MLDAITILILIAWPISMVIAHGVTYGSLQNNWLSIADEMRRQDRIIAFLLCSFGVITIGAVLLMNWLFNKKTVFQLRASSTK